MWLVYVACNINKHVKLADLNLAVIRETAKLSNFPAIWYKSNTIIAKKTWSTHWFHLCMRMRSKKQHQSLQHYMYVRIRQHGSAVYVGMVLATQYRSSGAIYVHTYNTFVNN